MSVQRALLIIADISGYTRFMRFRRMSLAHAQDMVARLLEAVIDAARGLRLIEFVLMGLLNPLTARTLVRHHGNARGWGLILALYLAAALSGLVVQGVFTLLGVQVTHVPWFRELVDKLMMMFPGTMLGAPGGMQGM